MTFSLALALTLATQSSPCPGGQSVVMTCQAKAKHIAVCIDAAKTPSFAQYRFGSLATLTTSPELVVPQDKKEGFKRFAFKRRDLVSGTSAVLTFQNGDVVYEVYTQDGKDAGGGVNVSQKGKSLVNVPCTGDFEENWQLLESFAVGGTKAPTSGGPRPDPTAGKSMKEICSDDVLLLTKYKWDDLRDGAFAKNCCVKGALGTDNDLCQLDWPSSDMPECGFFDELRNGIFARYGYQFKDAKWQALFGEKDWYQPRSDFNNAWLPAVATANVTTLKVFACPKPVTAEACTRAAIKWSLQLQDGARGQMDGMQQSEIADGLAAVCTKSQWNDQAVDCFAANKKKCDENLRGDHLTEAYDVIRAISADALK
jgi:hypothetical protein